MKILKRILLFLITIIVLFTITVFAVKIYNQQYKSPKGKEAIYEHNLVDIGHIPQYIQIRGEDKTNPVILVLHGGPASPMSYYSYYWQRDLEDKYTFVNWDQRGSGRTYYASPIKEQDVTTENILNDIDEIIEYIKQETHQDKVILLGHSWGTLLGNIYVRQHPEKIDRFIAIGQFVNMEGEMLAVQEAIKLAKQENDLDSVKEIENRRDTLIDNELTIHNIIALREYTMKYLPSGRNMSLPEQLWMGSVSPDAGMDDYRFFVTMMTDLESVTTQMTDLIQTMDTEDFLKEDTNFKMPYYFIQGEDDWITPTLHAKAYSEIISAPDVEFIQIKNAGHSPFLDKVGDSFIKELERVLSR